MTKKTIFYRIKALFLTSTIAAASLRGCAYGPPPPTKLLEQPQAPIEHLYLSDKINQKPDGIPQSLTTHSAKSVAEQPNGES